MTERYNSEKSDRDYNRGSFNKYDESKKKTDNFGNSIDEQRNGREYVNGNDRRIYDGNRGGYNSGNERRPYDGGNRGGYSSGNERRPYDGGNRGGYSGGNERRSYDGNRGGYNNGNERKSYDGNRKPYANSDGNVNDGNHRSFDGNERKSYGGERKSYDTGYRKSYDSNRGGYQSNDRKSYDDSGNKPSYGNNTGYQRRDSFKPQNGLNSSENEHNPNRQMRGSRPRIGGKPERVVYGENSFKREDNGGYQKRFNNDQRTGYGQNRPYSNRGVSPDGERRNDFRPSNPNYDSRNRRPNNVNSVVGADGRRIYGASGNPNSGKPYGGYNKNKGRFDGRKGFDNKRPLKSNVVPEKTPKVLPAVLPPKDETFWSVKTKSDGIRLNRYIAISGVCSRREADMYIETGVVRVNGVIVSRLGSRVFPGDVVHFGEQRLIAEKKNYVLLNKPKGYITTTDDPTARKTVMALVEDACKERVYPVGRLDRNTTGLLLFTNDGDLAKKLTHPSNGIRKLYHVNLDKPLTKSDFNKIKGGIELEDGVAIVDDLQYTGNGDDKNDLGIEIHMGKNRIVRRIFESLGYEVVKLDRVMIGSLTKKDLNRGRWRHLTEDEINYLRML